MRCGLPLNLSIIEILTFRYWIAGLFVDRYIQKHTEHDHCCAEGKKLHEERDGGSLVFVVRFRDMVRGIATLLVHSGKMKKVITILTNIIIVKVVSL